MQSCIPSSVKYGKDKPYINRYDRSYPGLHGPAGLHQEGAEVYPLQELITDTGLLHQPHFLPGLKLKKKKISLI